MEPLDRSTIWPYDERGELGEFHYQRYGSPTVAAAEAALGELDGGDGAPLPFGRGRDDRARPVAARARRHDRARGRRLLRHRRHLRALSRVGAPRRRVRPDRPAARGCAARLARGAVQPVPHHAGSRGSSRPSRARGRRRDRGHARPSPPARARRRLRPPQRNEVPRRPRRRAARRGRLPRCRCSGGAAALPRPHRHRRRPRRRLAPAARPEDARAARAAPDRDRASLAERLRAHPAVETVRYPGLGGLLSFDVADADAARKVETSTRVIVNATSLGGVRA